MPNQGHLSSTLHSSLSYNINKKLNGKNKKDLLPALPLPNINNAERKKIASISDKRKFSKGTVVFKQNTPDDRLFLLHKGLVIITCAIRENQTQIMSFHKGGDFFGETTFIEGKKHPASAVCTADSMISIINKKDFDQLAQQDPVLGIKILKLINLSLCSKLRTINDKVKKMGKYVRGEK
jgi:CRP/FNR family transcriptional regulator